MFHRAGGDELDGGGRKLQFAAAATNRTEAVMLMQPSGCCCAGSGDLVSVMVGFGSLAAGESGDVVNRRTDALFVVVRWQEWC